YEPLYATSKIHFYFILSPFNYIYIICDIHHFLIRSYRKVRPHIKLISNSHYGYPSNNMNHGEEDYYVEKIYVDTIFFVTGKYKMLNNGSPCKSLIIEKEKKY